jgi:hypothetical protein
MRSLSLAVLCVSLACASAVQATNRAIDLPPRYRAGVWADPAAARVHAADFDHDGKKDMLASSDRDLRFFRGLGDGTFADPVVANSDGIAQGLADFDRDGNLDLYFGRRYYSVAIMRGHGDGTFAAEEWIQTTADVSDVTAGDFNGDTYLDLACSSQNSHTVFLYYGNGDGAFTAGPTTPIPTTIYLRDLKAGDFDHNGKDDLFVLGDEQSVLAWNDGSGTFTEQEVKSIAGNFAAAGDVNGDNIEDVITLSGNEYAVGWVDVFLGAANHVMPSAARFRVGRQSGGLALAQMDGGGPLDIVIGAGDIIVITHDAGGFHTSAVAAEQASLVATGDFDGDGKKDVVGFQRVYPNEVFSFVRGNGDGTLHGDPSFQNLLTESGSVPAVTDLNADGRADLIILNLDMLSVVYANATGGFDAPITTPFASGFAVTGQGAGHVNGDGRIDVLLYGYDTTTTDTKWQPFFLNANGTFTPGSIVSIGPNVSVRAVGDFTGDARLDVLDSNGKLYVGNGSGGFAAGVATGMTLSYMVRTADVNNDGRLDVVTTLGDLYLSTAKVRSYINNVNGTFTAQDTPTFNGLTGLADLTGDGFPELFGGSLSVSLANGDGTFQDASFYLKEINVYLDNIPMTADFDGDSKLDVAFPGAVFYGTGDTKFDGGSPLPAVGDVISTADFDGNGSPDIWMADPSGARIVIVRTRLVPTGTAPASIELDLGTDPSRYSQQIPAKVTVAVGEEPVPRGAVVLERDSAIDSIQLPDSSGEASTYIYIPIGTSDVTATFTGDSHYASSTIEHSHTVLKAIPHVGFSFSPQTIEKGGSVNVCASALHTDYGVETTGSIVLRQDGAIVETFTAPSGCKMLTILDAGTYEFTAEYSGDERYEAKIATQSYIVTRYYTTMTLALPPPPAYAGQMTITASFPEDPAITGTVTFTYRDQSYPVQIANGQAVLTRSFPWGDDTLVAQYGGSDDFEPTAELARLFVYSTPVTSPPRLETFAFPSGPNYYVRITVPPVNGADHFTIFCSEDGGAFEACASAYGGTNPSTLYDYIAPNHSMAYTAVAHDSIGNSSPMGPRSVSSTFSFTDAGITTGVTKMKLLHVTQLQSAINGYRVAAGLPTVSFAALAEGSAISASQITAMRTALTEARSVQGRPTAFTDPTLTPGATKIRAAHVRELRDALR